MEAGPEDALIISREFGEPGIFDRVFEGRDTPPGDVVEDARKLVKKYLLTRTKSGGGHGVSGVTRPSPWTPTGNDASADRVKGCGVGVIARDEQGSLCFAAARSIQEGTSAESGGDCLGRTTTSDRGGDHSITHAIMVYTYCNDGNA